jgi:hypothetical protein
MDGIYVLLAGKEDIIYYDSVYDYLLDRVDVEDVLDWIDEIDTPIDIPYYGRALPSTVLKKFNIVELAVEDYLDAMATDCEYGLETEEYLTIKQFDSIDGDIISYDKALLNRLR